MYPADGSISSSDATGLALLKQHQELSKSRVRFADNLAKTGDLYRFESLMRGARQDTPVKDGSLAIIADYAAGIAELAKAPLHAPMPSWAVKAASSELNTERLQWYFRELTWPNSTPFIQDMTRFRADFPAEAPRLQCLMDEALERPMAKVHLRYAGCTRASTPEDRQVDDAGQSGSFWTNLVSFLNRTPDVYTLKVSAPCPSTEAYRPNLKLQCIERVLVSALTPLCGNSARGGFYHQPNMSKVSLAQASPLAVLFKPKEKEGPQYVFDWKNREAQEKMASMNDAVAEHFAEARSLWNTRTPGGISDAAFQKAVEWAKVEQFASGGVLNVRVAKDVTHEAFNDSVKDSGFFGAHCGPGPRLVRHAIHAISGGCDERLVMGPFVDLWGLSLSHWDFIIAIVTLCRILVIWSPLVIVAQSAQVATLLQFDDFRKVRLDGSLAEAVAAATEAADGANAITGA